jgi:H+/Cl- antiporter ClcA
MNDFSDSDQRNLAAAVTEVSERASLLVREEIELAKAEVTEKVTKLLKGAVVGLAAGIFAVAALLFALHGFSWLLNQEVFSSPYWGFFVVAGVLFVLGGVAGFLAARWLKSGSPPTPVMAIDEAQKIRRTLTGEPGGQLDAAAARAEAEGS